MFHLPNKDTLKEIFRLKLEGRDDEAKRLLIGSEAVDREEQEKQLVARGDTPSLQCTPEELRLMYLAYGNAALDKARGKEWDDRCTDEQTLALLALAYQRAHDALTKTDIQEALSSWWHVYMQVGIATSAGMDANPDYDIAPYLAELHEAESDHLTALLMEVDKKAEAEFAAAADLHTKREVAKSFCRTVEKAQKELQSNTPDLPCVTDYRITCAAWRERWQECSKAIAKEKAKARREAKRS